MSGENSVTEEEKGEFMRSWLLHEHKQFLKDPVAYSKMIMEMEEMMIEHEHDEGVMIYEQGY